MELQIYNYNVCLYLAKTDYNNNRIFKIIVNKNTNNHIMNMTGAKRPSVSGQCQYIASKHVQIVLVGYISTQERPLMQSIKGRRLIVNLLDQSFCAHCVVI